MAVHNFVALIDGSGNPLREMNGGARNADRRYDYRAITGRLAAIETDHTHGGAHRDATFFPDFINRPATRTLVLFEGSQTDAMERWSAARRAADSIEGSSIRYFILGPNSNTVAVAMIRAMGLEVPAQARVWLRAAGGRKNLSVPDWQGQPVAVPCVATGRQIG